jgi:hypothetical protein
MRGMFAFVRGFVVIWSAGCLLFSIAAAADLTFGLHWGWDWKAIPIGIGMALFGLLFRWLVGQMGWFMNRHIEPFLDSADRPQSGKL